MLVTSVIAGTAVAADGDAANTAETQAQPQTTARTVDKTVKSSDAAAQDDGSVVYSVDVPVAVADSEPAGSVAVDVTVPAGALPDGVSLEAAPVEDLDAVASELSDADVDYAGLLALDVRFTDADGNEAEPSAPVSVSFETPQAVLGEGIDASSVMVRHFVEDEQGDVARVETVADAGDESDGKVSVDGVQAMSTGEDADASVTAEFMVDSFSTFTITWDAGFGNKTNVQVNCYYIDENGIQKPIEDGKTPDLSRSLSSGQSISFAADNSDLNIEGYEYKHAGYVFNGETEQPLQSIKIGREGRIGKRYWYVSFNGGDHLIKNNDKPVTINLYYTKNQQGGGQGGGEVTQEATVTTGKTAVLKNDGSGNYNLTLTVSGDRGTSENKQKVDVLFILDESNSMMERWSGDTRIAQAKKAIAQITGYGQYEGLSDNDKLDVQYAMVGFYGGNSTSYNRYKDTSEVQSWTSDVTKLYNNTPGWLNDERQYGGTNYEAGFRTGKEVLDGARDDAMKVVIFISDGGPGYYYNDRGGTAGTGSPGWYDPDALQHGVDEVKTLTDMDYFYFVGVTGDVTSKVYTDITDAAPVATTNKQAISAANPDDLLEAFKDIQSDISHFAAKDVTVTDPLSQYADLVLTDGVPQFTITVKHGEQTWTGTVGNNGTVTFQDAGGNNKTATARVSRDNRTICLDLPDDYELEEGYTYSISTVIAPSQAAKSAGMDSDAAKQTPDDHTGTHSETNPKQQGFWSNDNENAKVTYTANGEKGSKNFPKPVIQVQEPKEVTIPGLVETKTVSGKSAVAGEFSFTVTTTGDKAEAAMSKAELYGIKNEDGTSYTYTFGNPEAITLGPNATEATDVDMRKSHNDGKGLTFTEGETGTYTYVYKETTPTGGWHQDAVAFDSNHTDQETRAWKVEITVTNDNGLQATVSVYAASDAEGGSWYTTPVFTHTYTPNSAESELSTPIVIPFVNEYVPPVSALPLTGGDATARNVLLAGGGVLLLAGGAWLLARRRRI